MNSRERILNRLRAARVPFDDVPSRPVHYLPVTRLTDSERGDLVTRFSTELERLTGKVYQPATMLDVMNTLLELIGSDTQVIAWDDLPLPGVVEVLSSHNIQVVTPHARGEERLATLQAAEPIRVGITGADAAFATTGTLVLASGAAQGRLPSLLPPVHIALLRRDRLFPRLEDWLTGDAPATLASSSSVVFVTGPSRTGDIEMKTILGVHGPGQVHVIVLP